MLQIDRRIFSHFDFLLPIIVFPIIAISFYLIYEANPTLATKQLVYFTVGFIIFIVFFLIPIRKLLWLIPFLYWINILLLISVKFFGVSKLGAQRWLEIPFVNFTIQPSEIFKPAFVLMLAYLIKKNPPDSEKGYGVIDFLKLSFYILLPFLLIAKEPDLGTAMMILLVGYGVLFIIGVNLKIWLTILAGLILLGPMLYNNLHDYQKKRINDFLGKPSYHVQQSVIAIGSGGLSGKKKEDATQTHFKFLPISTSDFIFAYLSERFGLAGGVTLIFLYALLIIHLLTVSISMQGDYFGQVVASSISLLFFLYMGVNIAMTIGFAPVVGVPLPIFSYGGSSFITFMIFFGIYENLVTFRFDSLYDSIKY